MNKIKKTSKEETIEEQVNILIDELAEVGYSKKVIIEVISKLSTEKKLKFLTNFKKQFK